MKQPTPPTLTYKATEMLVVGAFRYYLGRKTYAVGEFVDWLAQNWASLSDVTRDIVRRETRHALDKGAAGMEMDQKEWCRVLELDEPMGAIEAVLAKAAKS